MFRIYVIPNPYWYQFGLQGGEILFARNGNKAFHYEAQIHGIWTYVDADFASVINS